MWLCTKVSQLNPALYDILFDGIHYLWIELQQLYFMKNGIGYQELLYRNLIECDFRTSRIDTGSYFFSTSNKK